MFHLPISRAALSVAGLALITLSQANLLAWTQRQGSGVQDAAGQVAFDQKGNIYSTVCSDGELVLSKSESTNGRLIWQRRLGRATPVALGTFSGMVVVLANERDSMGRPHAVTHSINQLQGTQRWVARDLARPSASDSKGGKLAFDFMGNVYVGGSQDGMAAIGEFHAYFGTPVFHTTLRGSELTSFVLDSGTLLTTSEGGGSAWLSSLSEAGQLVREARLNIPGYTNAKYQNTRLYLAQASQSGAIWVAGDLIDKGKGTPFVNAFRWNPDNRVYWAKLGSGENDTVLDIRDTDTSAFASWQGVGGYVLKMLVASTDVQGRRKYYEAKFGFSGTNYHQKTIGSMPFAATRYVGSYQAQPCGMAFLAKTGWDIVLQPGSSTFLPALPAYDAGLASDDELKDAVERFGPVVFVTTYRAGRTEARLIKLQSPNMSSQPVFGGSTSSIQVGLGEPAPNGGYRFKVSTPAGSPLTPEAAFLDIPAGASNAQLRVKAKAVTSSCFAELYFTCQGKRWTVPINLMVPTLQNYSVTPAALVGCSTATGRVVLNGPAPKGGAVVRLNATSSLIDQPESVTIPEGAAAFEFPVCTFATTKDVGITLYAKYGSKLMIRQMTVLQPNLSGLRFDPITVRGGTLACAVLKLTGPAPASGLKISATCTGALLSPGALTMPYNKAESQFNLTTTKVSKPTSSTLTVSLNGRTMTATAVIVP